MKNDFLGKAVQIHGNKYDYSLVDYKNNFTKIKIICPIHGVFEQAPKSHLRGHGCNKCAIEQKALKLKKTTEEFIEAAKQIHGDKYDYSLVDYKNTSTKVKIICPEHGVFEQKPNDHLAGKGCPECGRILKSKKRTFTTEQFIERAKKIHGDKYDYSLINYVNCDTKVKIICPIHGVFEQTPINHINSGQNCPECGKLITSKKKTFTTEKFIEKAKTIHGDKYDYSLTNYVNCDTKVKIICPIHGVFEQTPVEHLRGCGCRKCAYEVKKENLRFTTEEFIERAKKIHGDKYDYSLVDYKNASTKVKIICPIHGEFEQVVRDHLNGAGCPSCYASRGEIKTRKFLIEKNIPFEEQKKFEDLKDKASLAYDFYLPDNNLLIEYNGIQHYKPIKHFGGYKRFLLQKHHDWLKRKYAKDNNIKLLTIPYWCDNLQEEILRSL